MKRFILFLIIAIDIFPLTGLYGQCTGALTVPIMGSSSGSNATTTITTQPISQTTIIGTPFTLTVIATSTNLTYQWKKNGNNLFGETNASFTRTAAVNDIGDYTVVVHGDCGADILSNVAIVILGGEIKLAAKVILEGAYDATNGLMRDVLRANNKLPTSQPYATLTFSGTTSSNSSSPSNHTGKEVIGNDV